MRQAIPYAKSELYAMGRPAARSGRQLDEIAFPLGGLGTGMVSLGGRGQLRDWEIMNRPAKGSLVPFSFFTPRILHQQELNVLSSGRAWPTSYRRLQSPCQSTGTTW